MNTYFIAYGWLRKKSYGPISEEGVWNLLAKGTIGADTLCCLEGQTEWHRVRDFFEVPEVKSSAWDWIGSAVEKFGTVFGWAVIAFVALGVLAVFVAREKDESKQNAATTAPMTERHKFWLAATHTIRLKLANPDEAEFCSEDDPLAKIVDELGDAAVVSGWVIEKTYSGKRRRLPWNAFISHDKDGWRALSYHVDGKTYGLFSE